MEEPERTNCFNSQPPRLLNTKTQTHERIICILQNSHDPSSLENYIVKICRNETRQRATCLTHGPSAIRRITLQSQHAGGLALTNKKMTITPRSTCFCEFPPTKTRKTSQREEPKMTLSRSPPKERCWMNWPLTRELKRTNMKKTKSVRNISET